MSADFDRAAWFENLQGQVDWHGARDVAFQLDGKDLVHIVDMDAETGDATVRVFASTAMTAPPIFEGQVNVSAHLAETCGLCGNRIERNPEGAWIDPNEIGNSPESCLLNESGPDQFGPHQPLVEPQRKTILSQAERVRLAELIDLQNDLSVTQIDRDESAELNRLWRKLFEEA